MSAKKLPSLTGVLGDLPSGLYEATGRVLNEMAALTRPESKAPVAEAIAAKEAATKADEHWQSLQKMATRVLGNGAKHGLSVSDWRAAMWKHPSYSTYNRVWQVYRQSTPEYKAWKKTYDAQRYKLRKLGLWERWQAEEAYSDAWDSLCEAYALTDVFGDVDRQRLTTNLENAIDALNTAGRLCFCRGRYSPRSSCESRSCQTKENPLDLHQVKRVIRVCATERLKAGGYDDDFEGRYYREDEEDDGDLYESYSPHVDSYDEAQPEWYGERSYALDDDEDFDDEDEEDWAA